MSEDRAMGQIEAAGGVLWRPAADRVEVALVHRPNYDDWSLPKGKLKSGEHCLVGAVREVQEETGYQSLPGRRVGQVEYLKDGKPKRVTYWSMQARGGGFSVSDEVDSLCWLPIEAAAERLRPDRDRPILEEFARDMRRTWPLVIARHASAGGRWEPPADDDQRPIDELGRCQSIGLASILALYRITRLVSASVVRCLETVGPYGVGARTSVEIQWFLSETGAADDPAAAADCLVEYANHPTPTCVCSQGKCMPMLLAHLCRSGGSAVPDDRATEKGGFWVFHLTSEQIATGSFAVTGVERFAPVTIQFPPVQAW